MTTAGKDTMSPYRNEGTFKAKPIPRIMELPQTSREDLFPTHIAVQYGLPQKFHTMEVSWKKHVQCPRDLQANSLKAVRQFAAHYAVDIDSDDTPVIPVDHTSKDISTKVTVRSLLREAPNNSFVAKRLGTGVLTSIDGCTSDEYEHFEGKSLSENEDGKKKKEETTSSTAVENSASQGDSSSSDSDDEPDKLRDLWSLATGGRNTRNKTHGLRKTNSRRIRRFRMGIGYAKLRLPLSPSLPRPGAELGSESEQQLIENRTRKTNGIDDGARLVLIRVFDLNDYRFLVVAAATLETVQDFISVAERWLEKRDMLGSKAKLGKFSLYRFTNSSYRGNWEYQGTKDTRPTSSVVLPDGQLEDILDDVRDFVAPDTRVWYRSHGLPHRRSFLFYGAPGTGKTSTIKMLAGLFKLNACFLSFTSQDFSNESLHDAISHLPSKALLVMEDVDALFNVDRKRLTDSPVTFSGLLNAMDGLISTDGIISIFTTNHIDRLDQALIRGGRIDRHFEFTHPGTEQLEKLFRSFYPDCANGTAREFADEVMKRMEPEEKSIATLQQHFIFTRKLSAEESVKKIPEFFKKFHPHIQDKGSMNMFV